MITNKVEARAILLSKGIKPTYQRLAILAAIHDNRSHPTIHALHKKLVKAVPTLSKTTLYATLGLFAGQGIVSPLHIDPAEIRYDGRARPHHHFHCRSCGKIFDLDIVCRTGRRGECAGHRIDEVHGYFKGICKDCLSKKYKNLKPSRRNHHV